MYRIGYYSHIVSCAHIFVTLAASSGMRNVTVWRPSVHMHVPSVFSVLNRASGVYSTLLARGQQATRPTNISDRQ